MGGLYRTPKDIERALTKHGFRPDHSAEADPSALTTWELPRQVRQKRKTQVEVEVDERKGTWNVYSGETRQQGKGGAQLAKALRGALAEVLPPSRGLKNGADNGKYQPQGVAQKDEGELEELTGTGGVAGFGTPYAFATKEPVSSKRKKKIDEIFESLIVEFRGVTPQQYRQFLKKHGLKMTKANVDVSTSTSHVVGDLWTQEPTNIEVVVSHLGNWKVSWHRDSKYGSGLQNLKSALSKYMSIRDSVNEGGDPYYGWRNDDTKTPKQKIGRAISEINKQLTEVEKVVKRTQRLKKETGTSNTALWNRTSKSLMKIEGRMTRISQNIRNMRG